LARAFYRDADIILLDDPLSAVDSRVGRVLFYSAIQDLGVRRGKCVVLVTHQHQFIGDSRCIMMSGGRVACVGSYPSDATLDGGGDTKTSDGKADDYKEKRVVGEVKRSTFLNYSRAMPGGIISGILMVSFVTQVVRPYPTFLTQRFLTRTFCRDLSLL